VFFLPDLNYVCGIEEGKNYMENYLSDQRFMLVSDRRLLF